MGGQPLVSVVNAEVEPVLGSGSKKSVGFLDSSRDNIVDEDSDVRLIPAEEKRILFFDFQGRIDACDHSLGCSLFIT